MSTSGCEGIKKRAEKCGRGVNTRDLPGVRSHTWPQSWARESIQGGGSAEDQRAATAAPTPATRAPVAATTQKVTASPCLAPTASARSWLKVMDSLSTPKVLLRNPKRSLPAKVPCSNVE